jgi:Flp pilus assembly protein TadD
MKLRSGVAAYFALAALISACSASTHNQVRDLGFDAAALTAKGDLDGAIREYREVLRLKPDYPAAHFGLGFALEEKGDHNGAIRECREALRLDPNNADAHGTLGLALDAKGDHDGAIREYREALRVKPDYARARNNLDAALRKDEALKTPH